jgi:hypothetical protein
MSKKTYSEYLRAHLQPNAAPIPTPITAAPKPIDTPPLDRIDKIYLKLPVYLEGIYGSGLQQYQEFMVDLTMAEYRKNGGVFIVLSRYRYFVPDGNVAAVRYRANT